MIKTIGLGIFLAALTFNLAGCKPSKGSTASTIATNTTASSTPEPRAPASNYFQTDFQDESQFIVETIVSDVAEQIYYAKFHRLPEINSFSVSANEIANSSFTTPTYDLLVDLDNQHHDFKTTLNVNGPIWSPEVYDDLTTQLARFVGLSAGNDTPSGGTTLLSKLTDGSADTIEKENQGLSKALADDFSDGGLHEQAALLLGAFTLREHSGSFYEIRSPLCRITAHLAMAHYLESKNLSTINGDIAEAILSTLMNNQADALEKLSGLSTNNPAVASWVRALQARNTGDYRPLDKLDGLSEIECINWFYALDHSANTDIAWSKLSDEQKRIADFVRIANEGRYSVEMGHDLLVLSLPLEFKEIGSIYQLSQQKELQSNELVSALNQMPDRCFSPGADGQTGVHVIGWGLWAGFLQRQLCHAIQHDYDFLERKWGVPDDAKSFSDKCDQRFGGLRLYPFVRRFNAIDSATYHQSVDDGFKVTVATPQLVPAECWDYLDFWLNPNDYYAPNPNPHINEWHLHNPPPGTAYNPHPRFVQRTLAECPNSSALLAKLHDLAPYDSDIAYFILKRIGGNSPDYEQATNLFQPVLAYATYAMITVASTPEIRRKPDRFEQLYSQAATLDPADYFTLGNYFKDLNQDDKAAAYYEKGNALCPDAILASYYANWLIHYYLKKGETEKARVVADNAGDVYSEVGLEAKADFLEATGDPDDAFEWYSKIEERYDSSGPLVSFCARYKGKTGDTRFDNRLQKLMGALFPQGMEKVKLDNFHSPPTDGVIFSDNSNVLRAAGLSSGDVIVAVYGIRVHNVPQYEYGRELYSTPELDLIVWQQSDRAYHEVKCSPPNHLFGVGIDSYRSP
jgi:tetratricopeptide (TPR) repeat protein